MAICRISLLRALPFLDFISPFLEGPSFSLPQQHSIFGDCCIIDYLSSSPETDDSTQLVHPNCAHPTSLLETAPYVFSSVGSSVLSMSRSNWANRRTKEFKKQNLHEKRGKRKGQKKKKKKIVIFSLDGLEIIDVTLICPCSCFFW